MPISLTDEDRTLIDRAVIEYEGAPFTREEIEHYVLTGIAIGIARAAQRLETSTFAAHEMETVSGCIALIRALVK